MNDFDLDQAREKEGGEKLEFLCVRMTEYLFFSVEAQPLSEEVLRRLY